MIDLDARKRLGRLMRNFATGRITNDEFDAAFEDIDSPDKAIWLVGARNVCRLQRISRRSGLLVNIVWRKNIGGW